MSPLVRPESRQMIPRLERCRPVRLAIALALLIASSTSAQAPPASAEPPPGYSEAVDEAIGEFNARRFAEARALFLRAHELSPNARTLRGLGASEFELRNYGESVRYLEQALACEARALEGDLRARAERLLERARGFVARFELSIQPASSTTVVDGVPLPKTRELLLEVGDHTLEVQAPGYRPEKRLLRIRGGESQRLHIELTMRIDLTLRQPEERNERRLYKSPWLWTAVGVLLVGSATAVALALQAREPHYAGGTAGAVVKPTW
jgi:hypothetical protein